METLYAILRLIGFILVPVIIVLVFRSGLWAVIRQALVITWQKKYLWFIGFFAGIALYGSQINFIFQQFDSVGTFEDYLIAIRSAFVDGVAQEYLQDFRRAFASSPWQMTGVLAVGVIFIVVVVWLVLVSQAALMRIAGRMAEKKPASFFDGLTVGIEKFRQTLQLSVIALLFGGGAWVVLAGIPATAYFASGNAVWAEVARIGSILGVLVAVILLFMVQYAIASMVLRNTTVVQAIGESWKLFWNNIMVSLEMAIIIFLFQMGLMIVVVSILAFLFFGFFTAQLTDVSAFTLGVAILSLILAYVSSVGYASWAVLYLRLLDGKAESHLSRWAVRLADLAGPKKITS